MKEVQELVPLFKWQRINTKEYFVLQAESLEDGDEYLNTLKQNFSQHKLDNYLEWDPKNLRILLPIEHFIQWQRSDLSAQLKDKKRIDVEKRVFYQRNDTYFTIKLKKEKIKNLREIIKKNSKYHGLKIKPIKNAELDIVEIKSNEYEEYIDKVRSKTRNRIIFNTRELYKDSEGQCYYYLPQDNESLEQLKGKTKSCISDLLTGKDVSIRVTINRLKNRVEISRELYDFINTNVACKPRKRKSTSTPKRIYVEKEDCFCTFPEHDKETLHDIHYQMQNYFNKLNKYLNIKVYIDEQNKCVCIGKEEYNQWQSRCVVAYEKWVKVSRRAFKFDKTSNFWEFKTDKETKLRNLYLAVKRACMKVNLDINIFILEKGKIRIIDENYKEFINRSLRIEASRNKAFGKVFKKDEKKRVFYYESDNNYNSVKSFNSLAKALNIKIKFYVANKRIELSQEDYKIWIANPIIQESLQTSKEPNPQEEVLPTKVTNTKASLKQGNPQRAVNTQGGISAKYLEGLFNVPFAGMEDETKETDPDLLSKGHVIPFAAFKNLLEPINHDRTYKSTVDIDFDGIKGKVTIYKSKSGHIQDQLSKRKIVFVRGGRKEEALIPENAQEESVEVLFLISRQEFAEMEKNLGYDPALRLPNNVKLCVIESCSLTSQPVGQPDSYVRASNIKRAVAFALAHCFYINQFILMDDNTTQIQMADKVANNASFSSLFKLFSQYKAKGAVCAMLGSFEFYKPITRPLDATEPEDIQERLGSKIMYVDYKRTYAKLKSEGKKLHELFSPCSLWWGEDYFNMLAILQLMQTEEQSGLLGVLPYSVAWHCRSHKNQNKAKQMPNFKLANIWLNMNEEYFKNLSPHHQQVIGLLQKVVKKAIEEQTQKMNHYLLSLDKALEDTQDPHVKKLDLELNEHAIFEQGYKLGQQTAKIGLPLNMEKLKKSVGEYIKLNDKESQEYISGFVQGHQQKWDTLSPEQRAYCHGYRDGKIAATKGYSADSIKKDKIPGCHVDNTIVYLQGFKQGNSVQWDRLKKADSKLEVEYVAKLKGSQFATSHFQIKEHKLRKVSEQYGDNLHHFETHFKAAFEVKRKEMSADEVNQLVIQQAQNLAKELSDKTILQLDMEKLNSASSKYGQVHYQLYKQTVVSEFNRLRSKQSSTFRSGISLD